MLIYWFTTNETFFFCFFLDILLLWNFRFSHTYYIGNLSIQIACCFRIVCNKILQYCCWLNKLPFPSFIVVDFQQVVIFILKSKFPNLYAHSFNSIHSIRYLSKHVYCVKWKILGIEKHDVEDFLFLFFRISLLIASYVKIT